MLEKYKNKKILIAGFEVEGKATFDFLEKNGMKADIVDRLDEKEFFKRNAELRSSEAKIILGENYLESVSDYDVIFRTPGLSYLNPQIQKAQKKGVEITSQINLFMQLCSAKTIGVTGTKGKGTTATLTYEILKASGKDAYLGGNIGVPAISFLNLLNKDSIVVLELSSFQLMDLEKSPNIAVVLNITQDHLDVHKDREEYVEAKKSIVKYQADDDFAVINVDYATSNQFKEETKADIFEVSTLSSVIPAPDQVEGKAPAGIQSNPTGFHLCGDNDEKRFFDSSLREVAQNDIIGGCYVNKNDEIILRRDGIEEKIASFSDLQLRGRHNLENVCAAVAASYLAGADLDSIRKTAKEFKGLEHRLEFVAEAGGVKYYNDSFSTTPETAIAATSAFSEPIILIAGGSEKGSDYTGMGRAIAEKVKTVFLIGKTAPEIKEKIIAINPGADIREGFTNMNDLVRRASEAADAGDVVVLSPGCASFDLFKNYKERGELFKNAVDKLNRD